MVANLAEPASTVLRERTGDWSARFATALGHAWDAASIEALHEELDALAIEADGAADATLSAAAVDLSIYLCSFVERGGAPSPQQRVRLVTLNQALATCAHSPAWAATSAPPAPAPAPALRVVAPAATEAQVLCVSDDPMLFMALEDVLGGRGIGVAGHRPADAGGALPRGIVQCVVTDGAALRELRELDRHVGALTGRSGVRPTVVTLLDDASTGERLRALRAGADHVVAWDGDVDALAERVTRILGTRPQQRLRALLIDDDRSQTQFCDSILRRFDVETVVCSDPAQATTMFTAHRPDVVLVDLHMPELDGLVLCERILELPGAECAAILFLSGDPEPETRFDALSAGGDDFLAKPVQPRHLVRAVLAHGKRAQRRRRALATAG